MLIGNAAQAVLQASSSEALRFELTHYFPRSEAFEFHSTTVADISRPTGQHNTHRETLATGSSVLHENQFRESTRATHAYQHIRIECLIQNRVAASAIVQVQTPGKQNKYGVDNQAEAGPHDDRPVERLVLRGHNLPLAATSVCAQRLLTAGLVALDVGSTKLENAGLQAVVSWTPWLRGLYAAGTCDVLKAVGDSFRVI